MKCWKSVQIVVAAVLLLVAANAMAAEKLNKTTMTVTAPFNVAGTTVVPGDYNVTWNGDSGQVQVTIVDARKKVVATTSATIETRNTAYNDTAVVTTKKGDALELVEIRPEGKKLALTINLAPGA